MRRLDPGQVYYPVTQCDLWWFFAMGALYGVSLGWGVAIPRIVGMVVLCLSFAPLALVYRRIGREIDERFAAPESRP